MTDNDKGIDLSILGIEDVPNTFAPPKVDTSDASTPKTESDNVRKIKEFVKGDKQREERKNKRPYKLPPKRKGQFVEPLTAMYGGIAAGLLVIDPVCAQAIAEAAPECARTLDELAYQNDAVRRTLIALTQTSAMGAVLLAHAPIIMTVVMHHLPNLKGSPIAAMMTGVPNMPEPKDDKAANE